MGLLGHLVLSPPTPRQDSGPVSGSLAEREPETGRGRRGCVQPLTDSPDKSGCPERAETVGAGGGTALRIAVNIGVGGGNTTREPVTPN